VYSPELDAAEHAFWTKLEFNRCTHCPLKSEEYRHCPAAVDLENIIPIFQKILSYERVTIEVQTPERTYSKHCDVQTGLRSLLGLVMATSACPVLSRLKGLASYHLPFATFDETLFLTVGAYLLSQYFRNKDGHPPYINLVNLDRFYKELGTVNSCFKKRIDATAERDANLNAIGALWALSVGVSSSLEEHIKDLKSKFVFNPEE
jgi:hypothetical protein